MPVLVEGLRRLEYRGYDSCGVAALASDRLERLRSVARVADLAAQIAKKRLAAETGIAHTRWATHGAPVTRNAHPIFSRGEIALVHNGIIENHDELRAELKAKGYVFETQTDTEVIAHLVHSLYAGSLFDAVRRAVKRLTGAYAIAVVAQREPHRVVGARAGSPLVVGVGKGENFLASDALALAGHHRPDRLPGRRRRRRDRPRRLPRRRCRGPRGEARRCSTVQTSGAAAELGPYRHFMQKEIFEQPRAVADTLEGIEAISPALFGDPKGNGLGKAQIGADPRLRHQLLLGAGREVLDRVARAAARRRSRSRASTATATACRIRTRWWWWCRSRARPPTRWPRSSTPARSGRSARWRSATSPPAR